MMARTARRMGSSFAGLLGRRLTPLEFDAACVVAEEWTMMESLSVVIAERLDWLRWITQTVNSKPGSKTTPPFRMPRPGEEPPESAKVLTGKEFADAIEKGAL